MTDIYSNLGQNTAHLDDIGNAIRQVANCQELHAELLRVLQPLQIGQAGDAFQQLGGQHAQLIEGHRTDLHTTHQWMSGKLANLHETDHRLASDFA